MQQPIEIFEFTNDFKLLVTGLVICLTVPGRLYELQDLKIVPHPNNGGTTTTNSYLITTNDGVKGTLVQSWDE